VREYPGAVGIRRASVNDENGPNALRRWLEATEAEIVGQQQSAYFGDEFTDYLLDGVLVRLVRDRGAWTVELRGQSWPEFVPAVLVIATIRNELAPDHYGTPAEQGALVVDNWPLVASHVTDDADLQQRARRNGRERLRRLTELW
jgi:hypothetical protein